MNGPEGASGVAANASPSVRPIARLPALLDVLPGGGGVDPPLLRRSGFISLLLAGLLLRSLGSLLVLAGLVLALIPLAAVRI
jgi:hypothetical protein